MGDWDGGVAPSARPHLRHPALEQGIARSELCEIKETRWRIARDHALAASGKTVSNVSEEAGAHWKIRITQLLRHQFSAPLVGSRSI